MNISSTYPHIYGWGWLQPDQKQKAWSTCHRPQSYCWFARPTGRRYQYLCCHFKERRTNSYSPYRAIQHTASPHLLRDLLTFPDDERGPFWDDLPNYGAIWDNVRFHHSHTIRQCFATHYRMLMEFFPSYSPFLNPIEEFYSAWRWKVYVGQPHTQMTLLHSKIFVPRCIAREDIRCYVDENL